MLSSHVLHARRGHGGNHPLIAPYIGRLRHVVITIPAVVSVVVPVVVIFSVVIFLVVVLVVAIRVWTLGVSISIRRLNRPVKSNICLFLKSTMVVHYTIP